VAQKRPRKSRPPWAVRTGSTHRGRNWRNWQRDLEQRLDKIQQHPEQNLGFIEEELARSSREPLRLLAERAAQAKAQCHALPVPGLQNPTPPRAGPWPRRCLALLVASPSIGAYGWWRELRDLALPSRTWCWGSTKNSPASPYLQEVTALLNSKMPSEQAVEGGGSLRAGTLPLLHPSGSPPARPSEPSKSARPTWRSWTPGRGSKNWQAHQQGPSSAALHFGDRDRCLETSGSAMTGAEPKRLARRPFAKNKEVAFQVALGLCGHRLPPRSSSRNSRRPTRHQPA